MKIMDDSAQNAGTAMSQKMQRILAQRSLGGVPFSNL
jgi:hypothetical protein